MDRAEFSKRLYSTVIPDGMSRENIQALTRPVSEAIKEMMPKSLFRFRAIKDKGTGSCLACSRFASSRYGG